LTLVEHECLPLSKSELPVLVTDTKEHFVALIRVNLLRGLHLADQQPIQVPIGIDAINEACSTGDRRDRETGSSLLPSGQM